MTTKTNLVVMTSILTFALIATVTLAFAQGEDTGMTTDNSTMMNATLAFAQGEDTGMTTDNSTMMNATLAFAQGEDEGDTGMTEGFGNDTGIGCGGWSSAAKDVPPGSPTAAAPRLGHWVSCSGSGTGRPGVGDGSTGSVVRNGP
jgi:hypothetical protein